MTHDTKKNNKKQNETKTKSTISEDTKNTHDTHTYTNGLANDYDVKISLQNKTHKTIQKNTDKSKHKDNFKNWTIDHSPQNLFSVTH